MSISSALSNGVTGLIAASRSAEVVSNNVANAMTDGYARREINLSTRTVGGAGAGVQVDGVTRAVDQAVIRDRRLADAALGERQTLSDFYDRMGTLVGLPDDPTSLTSRIASFETSLIEAGSRPDISARLQAVSDSARDLAVSLNSISDGIQDARLEADGSIARQVSELNTALEQVADLNQMIVRFESSNRDSAGLYDRRQQVIDRISEIVPVREIPRDNGAIALYTTGGATLLDGRPSVVSFSPVALITYDMTRSSGALSGIEINGAAVATDGSYSPIRGGSLAASFEIRDSLAIEAQARIDSVARDVAERFQSAGLDPTLAPGDPGLFVDGGLPFDPLNEEGFAGRIALNALADPARGGDLWRLRSGLGAAAPGPVGDSSLLEAMSRVLTESRIPSSTAITSVSRSASGLAAELQSLVGREGLSAETSLGYASAKQDSLLQREREGGVDTDQEMQKLLLIEQAYTANARVIQTIDEMFDVLLGL